MYEVLIADATLAYAWRLTMPTCEWEGAAYQLEAAHLPYKLRSYLIVSEPVGSKHRISTGTSSQVRKFTVYIHASGTVVKRMQAMFQLYHLTRSSSIKFARRAKRLCVNCTGSMR